MSKQRYRPEEIIGKLREADVLISQGKKVVEIIKALGVTDVTYYRWRQEYGGCPNPRPSASRSWRRRTSGSGRQYRTRPGTR